MELASIAVDNLSVCGHCGSSLLRALQDMLLWVLVGCYSACFLLVIDLQDRGQRQTESTMSLTLFANTRRCKCSFVALNSMRHGAKVTELKLQLKHVQCI